MKASRFLGAAVLATAVVLSPIASASANGSVRHSKGASAQGGAAAGLHGEHTMSGTVTDVDKKTGIVGLKTAEGNLRLHFPPKSLAHVKEGEELKVQLGFSPVM